MLEIQEVQQKSGAPDVLIWKGWVSHDRKEDAARQEEDEKPLDPKELEEVMARFTAVTLPD